MNLSYPIWIHPSWSLLRRPKAYATSSIEPGTSHALRPRRCAHRDKERYSQRASCKARNTLRDAVRIKRAHAETTQNPTPPDIYTRRDAPAWINLRTLEIDGPGAEADVAFLRCLAEHCPALRVAYTAAPPPALDVTARTTSHLLEELRIVPLGRGDIWNHTKITRLAQYFDHFFPNLVIIHGEGHLWWEEVEQLVFGHQDRRRTNSQKMVTC
ncbi:hypothetical protein B0H14DRAFT_3432709 [Mycena olivaceomarginata]|nr:hypothetical protein B0H14DRAFT_3432709 [Mycena olivaceomarginata]